MLAAGNSRSVVRQRLQAFLAPLPSLSRARSAPAAEPPTAAAAPQRT
jgi:hypothetical protein